MVQWAKLFAIDGGRDSHRYRDEIRHRKLSNAQLHLKLSCMTAEEFAVLPTSRNEIVPSAVPAKEVSKVALRLKYLIEEAIPCELEEDRVTKANSNVITKLVLQCAREAGGVEYKSCVVYCLLVCKRWFLRLASLELWDADLHNVRAVACEVLAKRLFVHQSSSLYLGLS